jgi:DNA-binding NarL/FixJ family response regulator
VPIRVVLAEDNLLVREGLVRLLERQPEIEVAAACADADELLATVEATEPQVVVTDIRMPPGDSDEGIRLAARLRVEHPQIGVVVVSQHADPAYALALFDQGSQRRAFLLKERIHRIEELVDAIVAVADGGSVVDPVVVEGLVAQARKPESALSTLTRRELEILDLMAQGKNNRGIAAQLYLTEHSVEKYVSSVLGKLDLGDGHDVHRRVKAVLVYLTDGAGTAPAPPTARPATG